MSGYEVRIGHTPEDMYGNSDQFVSGDVWANDSVTDKDYDAARGGATVRTEAGAEKIVTSLADLKDTDRVTVLGIPMTVKQARDSGFSDQIERQVHQSAERVRTNDVALRSRVEAEQVEQDKREYERASKVEQGLVTHPELNAAETVANTLALHTGISEEATAELVFDTVVGQVDGADEVFTTLAHKGISKEGWHSMVKQGQQLVADAARKELGAEKFNRLQALARQSASVNRLVIEHGIKRSRGKATVPWSEVLNLAEQFVRR